MSVICIYLLRIYGLCWCSVSDVKKGVPLRFINFVNITNFLFRAQLSPIQCESIKTKHF